MRSARRPWLPALQAALLLGLLVATPWTRVSHLFHKHPAPNETVFRFVDNDKEHAIPPSVRVEKEGVTLQRFEAPDGPDTLVVDGGLTLTFDSIPGSHTTLFLEAYSEPMGSFAIGVLQGEKTRRLALTDRRRLAFDLSRFERQGPLSLQLVPTAQRSRLFIQKLILERVSSTEAPPNLALIVAAAGLLFLVSDTLLAAGRRRLSWMMAAVVASAAMIGARTPGIGNAWLWFGALMALVLARQWIAYRDRRVDTLGWFVAIAVLGVVLRWDRFLTMYGQPLLGVGDESEYKERVEVFSWARPFANGHREPFFIWFQKVLSSVFGPATYQFRLGGFLTSTATLLLTFPVARKLSGRTSVALMTMAFMAVHSVAVFSSASGERTELYQALALALAWVVLMTLERTSWTKEILLAGTGAALTLTWIVGAISVVALYAARALSRRQGLRRQAAGAALFVLLLLPFLVSQYRRFGDPFFAANQMAGYWDSAQRYRDAPVPRREWEANTPRTTWTASMFKERGLGQALKQTLLGYAAVLADPRDRMNKSLLGVYYTSAWNWAIMPFFLAGLAVEIKRKRFWCLVLLAAFLNGLPYLSKDLISPRYLLFAAPFFGYFTATGVALLRRSAAGYGS